MTASSATIEQSQRIVIEDDSEVLDVTNGVTVQTNSTRAFSGWYADFIVVLVGAIAMAATYPGRTHGLGMVTEPLLQDFQLSTDDGRVLFATINFWATLIGSVFCIPIGWLFDRFDRRSVLAANLTLLGLVVIGMSQVTSLWALAIAIILTRGLGQSALSVVSVTIVAKSFSAQRLGLAMAWYAVLSAPFHLALIQGVGWAFTLDGISWRTIWAGIGVSLVALSGSAWLLRQSCDSTAGKNLAHNSNGFTLRQALRTPAFWTFSLTISAWGMIYAGVALFNEDIFRERGFERRLYFNVLAEVTLVAICAKFFFGWLVNYIPLNRLLAACLIVTSLSLVGLTQATEVWHAYVYGVGLGIASGAIALLFFATWGRLYGNRELGRIQGVAQMLTVFASAAGPVIFTASKRATTSYTFIFMALASFMFAMAIVALFTALPNPNTDLASTSDH
ncbi:MAG: MFS transporter [Planctomycetales bacterium]|nr:MFS transporter [Planctomycetales bacterium]